ncbi:hypothetical protein E0L17_10490 [Olsenella sp. SW781]|uniref:hypothetical protein n=1 Tax=Olsenella sp. SW781 TaxID=2530046 RepID=UPI00143BB4CC|nr:hypothetical protein [Olsenella sp. SW781]NJE81740.1 hypothetical protein [Olsenella sp. SW781]
MKPKTSRGIAVAAIVVILAVTFVSCVTLPRNDAHGPEADVPGAQALVSGEDDAVALTLGNYTWSFMNGSERRIEELRQIDPQKWHVDELAQVSAAAGSTIAVCFDEEPLWAYARSWDEEELADGSIADSPLFWRVRTLIDTAESVGDEVISTFEDGVLTFEVEPGRRYAISATYEKGFSGNDHIEYVFTVR